MSRTNLSVEADVVAAKINADVAALGRVYKDGRAHVSRAVVARHASDFASVTEEVRAEREAESERLTAEQNKILDEMAAEMERIREASAVIQRLAPRLLV